MIANKFDDGADKSLSIVVCIVFMATNRWQIRRRRYLFTFGRYSQDKNEALLFDCSSWLLILHLVSMLLLLRWPLNIHSGAQIAHHIQGLLIRWRRAILHCG